MIARKEMMAEYLTNHGFTALQNLDEAFEKARPWFWEIYHREQRTPTLEERLEWVLDYCGIALTPGLLEPLAYEFAELGLMLNPTPTPNIKEVLAELSQSYLLGIVSDTGYTPGRVLRKHLEVHGIHGCFSALSFSNETGHAKPNANAFLVALNQLGVDSAHAIHCGDLPDHDIRGARDLGLTAVLYTGCHISATDGVIPDYTISDWLELPAIVRQVFGSTR
jgi:putative hydrolase of the HAD superfamily